MAEDLTQDVFLKLARSDQKELHAIKSWVFTVARNTLIDHYRKTQNTAAYNDEFNTILEAETEDAIPLEISQSLFWGLSQLEEQDKKLLTQIDLESQSQKQLSESLKIDYTTLKSRVQRARKKLYRKLMGCCQFAKDSRGHVFSCQDTS